MIDVESTLQSQYANSPTIVQLATNMNSYLDPIANIDAFYDNVFNILTAVGEGLDIWGRILQFGRVVNIPGAANRLHRVNATPRPAGAKKQACRKYQAPFVRAVHG